jgi:hypothetical protein
VRFKTPCGLGHQMDSTYSDVNLLIKVKIMVSAGFYVFQVLLLYLKRIQIFFSFNAKLGWLSLMTKVDWLAASASLRMGGAIVISLCHWHTVCKIIQPIGIKG